MDISTVKSQFPIFSKKVNGKSLVYLDSSNSSQKPASVLKCLDNFYNYEFSNVGRSIHTLAVNATNKFEETRENVKNFSMLLQKMKLFLQRMLLNLLT